MKITVDNLVEQYPKLNIPLPKELNKDEFEFVQENIDLYKEDDTIKKYIDTFVLKLNEIAAKKVKSTKKESQPQKRKPKSVSDKKMSGKANLTVEKPKTEKKQTAKEKTKPKANITPIEHFTLEEKFIKRYLALDGKVKTKDQILGFVKSLQKTIIDKQIRKTSKYADIIEHIQKNLVKLYNITPDSVKGIKIELVQSKIEELQKIVGDKKVRLSVAYIKRFIGLYGKETKEKVKRLLTLIEKALENGKIPKNDLYFKEIQSVKKALTRFMNGYNIEIDEAELKGLAGIAGCDFSTLERSFKPGTVISSNELKGAFFNTFEFTGEWLKIIGDPEIPFYCMIYGPGGKGKSTFAVRFAKYLSKDLNKKVLFVANEEKLSKKLKEKLQLFNAYNPNLFITDNIPGNLKNYNVVILDSVTSLAIEPEDFETLKKNNPGISFVYILQTIKSGDFKGKKDWEHNSDVKLRFEDGKVTVEKSRFGGRGIIQVREK